MPRGRIPKQEAVAVENEQSALAKANAELAQMKIRMAQMEEFIRNNPAGKPKAVEQFVLVAALNPKRTRFGGVHPIVFVKQDGYEYPVAEMEAGRAKNIITAEVDNRTYNFCYASDIKTVIPVRKTSQEELVAYQQSRIRSNNRGVGRNDDVSRPPKGWV